MTWNRFIFGKLALIAGFGICMPAILSIQAQTGTLDESAVHAFVSHELGGGASVWTYKQSTTPDASGSR
jgi:hypothetical protein